MSRSIDLSDPAQLTDEDKRYLQERGRLPKGVDPVPLGSNFTPVGDLTNTGTANTAGITAEELEASQRRIAELEAQLAEKNRETDLKELERQKANVAPTAESEQAGGEVETYRKEEGWSDDRLREELARRNLDTDGDRKELRVRLMKADRGQE